MPPSTKNLLILVFATNYTIFFFPTKMIRKLQANFTLLYRYQSKKNFYFLTLVLMSKF